MLATPVLRTLAATVVVSVFAATACAPEDSTGEPDPIVTTTAPDDEGGLLETELVGPGLDERIGDEFRIVMSGDSIMAGLYPAVEAALERSEPQTVRVDWLLTAAIAEVPEARLLWERTVEQQNPDDEFVAIFMLGWWENVRLQSEALAISPQTDGWTDRYFTDVAEPWRDLITSRGGDLIWVTMPPVVTPERSEQLAELNAAWTRIEDDDSTLVFDGAAPLSVNGRYKEFGTLGDGDDGEESELLRLRNLDGLHLCPAGAIALARPLLLELRERYGLVAKVGWEDREWTQDETAYPPEECPGLTEG